MEGFVSKLETRMRESLANLKKTQIRPFVIEDEKRLVFLPDDNKSVKN